MRIYTYDNITERKMFVDGRINERVILTQNCLVRTNDKTLIGIGSLFLQLDK